MEIIDAWMQHPSAEFLADPVFDSLRRWAHGRLAGGEIPVAATVAAMDEAGVRTGMLCAWWGPRGPLISNDAVAAMVGSHPDRFAGVAAVDLAWPAADCLRDLAGLGLDDETTQLFLHGNAERVFGLAPAPEPGAATGQQAAGQQDTSR